MVVGVVVTFNSEPVEHQVGTSTLLKDLLICPSFCINSGYEQTVLVLCIGV